MVKEGVDLSEGNMNDGWSLVDNNNDIAAPKSFAWRGGTERQTTGIWMWSEPFIRTTVEGETVAVLLMDTQGNYNNY